MFALAASARADDSDALDLRVAPAAEAAVESGLRAYVEIAAGRIDRRDVEGPQDGRRASLDIRYAGPLTERWRFGISNRLDDTHPTVGGMRTTTNSLREAWLGWQQASGGWSAEAGRINLRLGPSFGYSPTDYFRLGALRTVTTLDPVTLRETRMGTVMVRMNRLWSDGGATLALAPKVRDAASQRPASLDLGATNHSDRALLTVNQRFSEQFNGQWTALFERGAAPAAGASFSALIGDSVVLYGEWSSSKSLQILDAIRRNESERRRVQQAAFGLTWTLPTSMSVTMETEYNGAGLDRSGLNAILALGPQAYQAYQDLIQPSQDLGSRRAWLLYATQKGFGYRQLDFTAFLRVSAVDRSRLAWAELRYHWPRFDAAVQWQAASGGNDSEYGFMPFRRVIQMVGTFFY